MHGSIEAMVVAASSDEEDEDFVPEKDDAGSPTDDDSEEEGSDAPKDGDGEEPKNKEPAASMPAAKKKKRDEGEDDGKKKERKKKRKKDRNAPKRPCSSFMFFSQAERTRLGKTNPGMPFKDVAKVIGEGWKKMTAEEKEPYEASAKRDKTRYTAEMAVYKGGKDASAPTGGLSPDEDSD